MKVGTAVLVESRVARLEHRSPDGDVAAMRRPLFDWLERRSPDPVARESMLDLVTTVVDELATPTPIPFTVSADDCGDNVLVRVLIHDAGDDVPVRLGRGLAAVDRLSDRLDVVPAFGDDYVLLDVVLRPR